MWHPHRPGFTRFTSFTRNTKRKVRYQRGHLFAVTSQPLLIPVSAITGRRRLSELALLQVEDAGEEWRPVEVPCPLAQEEIGLGKFYKLCLVGKILSKGTKIKV